MAGWPGEFCGFAPSWWIDGWREMGVVGKIYNIIGVLKFQGEAVRGRL